jgi:lipopolysaccharide export system protein LptA
MNMTGKILMATLCAFLLAVSAHAADWGEIREAASNLNVREKRTPKSEHMVTLNKGQRVKVDFFKDGWFAVFPVNETERSEKRAMGYANAKYLVPVSADATVTPAPEAEVGAMLEAKGREGAQTASVADVAGDGEVKAEVDQTPPDPIKVGIDPSRIPVKITSDRMTYDENGKVVSFVGNVVAEHGELTLWAERLSAYFASKSGKKFAVDSVERIVAEGNVRAKRGKTEGSCGKLTYHVEEQVLKMEEDPVLQDGPNSLTGDVIKFYVRENRSEVVGGKGKRVKAIFLTPEKIKVQ